MSGHPPDAEAMVEPCSNCDRETPHSVTVELRTESDGAANPSFSREPYRVTECRRCGEALAQRMSDA
ncbi:DUF7835 family putative zinc beta-ribbon protein [Halobacterium jilantaiense]|uniref:DUF7835 domain-containing protein n=1 Tax=Halobacterium jilantaiense TaxID=355548 RepID=A0A1I0QFX1_9EURY|nr:hypothetical protein [Halobacterium jilantaiense]SEW25952.1 hypothetical protein SAMN04487945_2572 [Halobacterium jilantaiense]